MATRKPMFLGEVGGEEMASTDDMALGGLAMSGNVTMAANKLTGLGSASGSGEALVYGQSSGSLAGLTLTDDLAMGTKKITGLDDGTAGGDAVNKSQLDTAVISGGKIKEFLLHPSQLNDAEGVLAAIALVMQVIPVGGDVISITDGVTTRTYGATSGGDVQYTIGGTIAATMANLAAAILGDGSGAWGALYTTDLDAIDTDGVVVIYELDNDAGASKLYGTWATPADCQVVDFEGEAEYTKKALTTMTGPGAPANSNFGIRRTQSALVAGEIHYCEDDDTQYYWDIDTTTWFTMTGAGSIPDATSASGGGVKGKVTFDRDFGLVVASGIAKVSLAASKGLSMDGSGDVQGVANASAGMAVGASGFEVDLADTNPCLLFASGIGLQINGTTLEKTATGARVKGLPSQFEVGGVAVGTPVSAPNLDTLTDGSDADALHTHNNVQATRLEAELIAEEALSKGDPVEWGTTNDKVRQSRANLLSRVDAMAVVEESAGIAPDAVGTCVRRGPATVLTGATVGDRYYVDNAGGLVAGKGTISAGNHVIFVGTAINATELEVHIRYVGQKAA